jgi:hypothetical protein
MLCPSEINRFHIIAGLLRNLDSGFGASFLDTKINFHRVVVAVVGRGNAHLGLKHLRENGSG